MTTHVICLDGTNQMRKQPFPTNITFLYQMLGGQEIDAGDGSFESSDAGRGIRGKYLPGVGSNGHPVLRVLGNLFGDGIAESIIRGYTFLSRNYQDGDAIVITGFSRGATAARALAGWVASVGLLDPSRYDVHDKDQAYRRAISAWYDYRDGRPDLANQARLRFIELLAGKLPKLQTGDFTAATGIDVVGVFDTVSSLGIPILDPEGRAVFDFSICDTHLSPKVKWGFHALAADETRDLFTPTFWAARDNVVQEIFPGAHSDVGGGSYPEHGLSDAALAWMTEKLNIAMVERLGENAPLFQPSRLPTDRAGSISAPAHDEALVFPYVATPRHSRSFPHIAKPSDVLKGRYRKPSIILPGARSEEYRPKGRYADGSEILP